MAELADAVDSKSTALKACRFESGLRHQRVYADPIGSAFYVSRRPDSEPMLRAREGEHAGSDHDDDGESGEP